MPRRLCDARRLCETRLGGAVQTTPPVSQPLREHVGTTTGQAGPPRGAAQHDRGVKRARSSDRMSHRRPVRASLASGTGTGRWKGVGPLPGGVVATGVDCLTGCALHELRVVAHKTTSPHVIASMSPMARAIRMNDRAPSPPPQPSARRRTLINIPYRGGQRVVHKSSLQQVGTLIDRERVAGTDIGGAQRG